MDNLYDYFLHYNVYTENWNAVKRNVSNQYLNGTLPVGKVIKNKDVNKLIEIIVKLKK